jgi:hypothetical protein
MSEFLIGFVSSILVIGAVRWVVLWRRYRGARAITCPANLRPAGVQVDAHHATLTGLAGAAQLRLSSCSRWPENAGCGQECLSEIQAAPDGCLVRNILAGWYRGKPCAFCGRVFGDIEWNAQKPALLSADKITVEWERIPAERLQATLQTALPVCFACHMANTLVREHPDLVIDRSRRIPV